MSPPLSRGERNNNPGNIDYLDPPHAWQGQVGLELVPEGKTYSPRFGRYDCAENGIAAIAKQLLVYLRKHGCDTPRELLLRWAPPSENATTAYVLDLAAVLGVDPDTVIDLEDPATLAVTVRCIIRHENGRCLYDPATIAAACQLALAPAT